MTNKRMTDFCLYVIQTATDVIQWRHTYMTEVRQWRQHR